MDLCWGGQILAGEIDFLPEKHDFLPEDLSGRFSERLGPKRGAMPAPRA